MINFQSSAKKHHHCHHQHFVASRQIVCGDPYYLCLITTDYYYCSLRIMLLRLKEWWICTCESSHDENRIEVEEVGDWFSCPLKIAPKSRPFVGSLPFRVETRDIVMHSKMAQRLISLHSHSGVVWSSLQKHDFQKHNIRKIQLGLATLSTMCFQFCMLHHFSSLWMSF